MKCTKRGGKIRRSSKGIAACIVEGYGRRKYKADFVKFLVYAHASCDETIVHPRFLKDTSGLNAQEIDAVVGEYENLGGKINSFIQYVEISWKEVGG